MIRATYYWCRDWIARRWRNLTHSRVTLAHWLAKEEEWSAELQSICIQQEGELRLLRDQKDALEKALKEAIHKNLDQANVRAVEAQNIRRAYGIER